MAAPTKKNGNNITTNDSRPVSDKSPVNLGNFPDSIHESPQRSFHIKRNSNTENDLTRMNQSHQQQLIHQYNRQQQQHTQNQLQKQILQQQHRHLQMAQLHGDLQHSQQYLSTGSHPTHNQTVAQQQVYYQPPQVQNLEHQSPHRSEQLSRTHTDMAGFRRSGEKTSNRHKRTWSASLDLSFDDEMMQIPDPDSSREIAGHRRNPSFIPPHPSNQSRHKRSKTISDEIDMSQPSTLQSEISRQPRHKHTESISGEILRDSIAPTLQNSTNRPYHRHHPSFIPPLPHHERSQSLDQPQLISGYQRLLPTTGDITEGFDTTDDSLGMNDKDIISPNSSNIEKAIEQTHDGELETWNYPSQQRTSQLMQMAPYSTSNSQHYSNDLSSLQVASSSMGTQRVFKQEQRFKALRDAQIKQKIKAEKEEEERNQQPPSKGLKYNVFIHPSMIEKGRAFIQVEKFNGEKEEEELEELEESSESSNDSNDPSSKKVKRKLVMINTGREDFPLKPSGGTKSHPVPLSFSKEDGDRVHTRSPLPLPRALPGMRDHGITPEEIYQRFKKRKSTKKSGKKRSKTKPPPIVVHKDPMIEIPRETDNFGLGINLGDSKESSLNSSNADDHSSSGNTDSNNSDSVPDDSKPQIDSPSDDEAKDNQLRVQQEQMKERSRSYSYSSENDAHSSDSQKLPRSSSRGGKSGCEFSEMSPSKTISNTAQTSERSEEISQGPLNVSHEYSPKRYRNTSVNDDDDWIPNFDKQFNNAQHQEHIKQLSLSNGQQRVKRASLGSYSSFKMDDISLSEEDIIPETAVPSSSSGHYRTISEQYYMATGPSTAWTPYTEVSGHTISHDIQHTEPQTQESDHLYDRQDLYYDKLEDAEQVTQAMESIDIELGRNQRELKVLLEREVRGGERENQLLERRTNLIQQREELEKVKQYFQLNESEIASDTQNNQLDLEVGEDGVTVQPKSEIEHFPYRGRFEIPQVLEEVNEATIASKSSVRSTRGLRNRNPKRISDYDLQAFVPDPTQFSKSARNFSWSQKEKKELFKMLEVGERHKWRYISDRLSERPDGRIPLKACRLKFESLFGQAEASSQLQSSLFYLAYRSGWEAIQNERTLDDLESLPQNPSRPANDLTQPVEPVEYSFASVDTSQFSDSAKISSNTTPSSHQRSRSVTAGTQNTSAIAPHKRSASAISNISRLQPIPEAGENANSSPSWQEEALLSESNTNAALDAVIDPALTDEPYPKRSGSAYDGFDDHNDESM